MEQHRHKAHIGQLAVMFYTSAAHGSHQVATEKTEIGRLVLSLQRAHQPRRMEISTRLAYNQIIFQDRKSTRLNSSHANISYAVFCLKKTNKASPLRYLSQTSPH